MNQKQAQLIFFLQAAAFRFSIVLVMLLNPSIASSAELTGIPRVVDGDTIVMNGMKLRLEGVDAPETDQICLDDRAQRWTCGIAARDQLAQKIGSNSVTCSTTGVDKYGRSLAFCRLGDEDLNRWLVRQGLALSFVRYSSVYDNDEAHAREERNGLWKGAFVAPWDWRQRNEKTVVLGARSVPLSARPELLSSASSSEAPSPDCVIKGNVSRNGQRFYYMPNQIHYGQIRMNRGNGKRWFCTEEEAEVAGWRRSTR